MSRAELLDMPCRALCRTGAKIVTVTGHMALPEAFTLLEAAHILSAPCRLEDGRYAGFLEMRDLVSVIVFSNEQKDPNLKTTIKNFHSKMENEEAALKWDGYLSKKEVTRFAAKYPGQVEVKLHQDPKKGVSAQYLARRHPFVSVSPDEKVSKLISLLCQHGCRRVAVVEDGQILDIISQSVLVRFLYKNADKLSDSFAKECGTVGSSPVLQVHQDSSTFEAFKLMDKHSLHGIALVDGAGVITGNTSASDLKLYMKDQSMNLSALHIFDFLKKVRQAEEPAVAPVMRVKPTDTLDRAVGMLCSTKRHRIFVVDDKGRPQRIISLTDIIATIGAE